ncbi:MAG: hypothetical protein LBQ44_04285 [Treponema sp.]|jgi:hypothetical protein|nr:hypothetical protein [Treponema sp.]
MKKSLALLFVFGCALLCALPLAAQSGSLNAMSLNGVTGLYVVPTGRIGWKDVSTGFNAGYHMNFLDDKLEDLFQANVSLFNWVEIAAAYAGEPYDNDDDLLMGVKVQLPVSAAAIAVGGNLHYSDLGRSGDHFAMQLYGAVTYTAEFFGMPADTTLMAGKTFYEGGNIDSSIDFGMGFDLVVLPQYLDSFVHWIVDFSNFGYSQGNSDASFQAYHRGAVNTGLRIDMSQIPVFEKFNFVIDAYITDAFDSGSRHFGLGASFGMSF